MGKKKKMRLWAAVSVLLAFIACGAGELSVASRLEALSRAGASTVALSAAFGDVADGATITFEGATVEAMMHSGNFQLTAVGTDAQGRARTVVLDDSTSFRQGDAVSGTARITGMTSNNDLVATPDPGSHVRRFDSSTQSHRSTGRRRIRVYRITFAGATACGSLERPVACIEPPSMERIKKALLGPGRSAADILHQASFGRFTLEGSEADWKSETVAENTAFRDLETMFPDPDVDFVSFFLPQNYFRGIFAGGMTQGVGVMGKRHSWMMSLAPDTLAHEIAHNMGGQHSGRWNVDSRRLEEYADFSSILSGGPAYVGMPANQLFSLGWLPLSAVVQIRAAGTFKIAPLYGGGSGQNFRAAVVEVEGHRPNLAEIDAGGLQAGPNDVWIEFREKNSDSADRDLFYSQRDFDRPRSYRPTGQLTGTLLVHGRRNVDRLTFPFSQLLAIVSPGTSWTEPNSGLRIDAGAVPGEFSVSNIRPPARPALTTP